MRENHGTSRNRGNSGRSRPVRDMRAENPQYPWKHGVAELIILVPAWATLWNVPMKKFHIPQVSEKHRLGSRAGSDAGKAGAADQVVCIPGGFMLCLVLRWGAFAGWIGCLFVCAAHEVVHGRVEKVSERLVILCREGSEAVHFVGENLFAHTDGERHVFLKAMTHLDQS